MAHTQISREGRRRYVEVSLSEDDMAVARSLVAPDAAAPNDELAYQATKLALRKAEAAIPRGHRLHGAVASDKSGMLKFRFVKG